MLSLSCVFVMLIDALWSPAGKGLTSWPSFVMSNCVTFPCAVILLLAHPASFAHNFLFQRVPGCNSIADLSLK